MSAEFLVVDVRELLYLGEEPFGAIMKAASELAPGQALKLLAPFEPAPLYHVMRQQGLSHSVKMLDDGTWEIIFSPA